MEGYFRNAGFGQKTVRDSRNDNGIRDMTATQEAGFAKCGHGFGIEKRKYIWDSDRDEKEAGIRDPDPGDGGYLSSRLGMHTCLFESITHSEQNESRNGVSLVFVLDTQ